MTARPAGVSAAHSAAGRGAVAVVDYGMGNLGSVANAIARLGYAPRVTRSPAEIAQAPAIVLPGVGSFAEAIGHLRTLGLAEALKRAVFDRGTPFLGICLGMQLIARSSTEGGLHEGLGWIDAEVDRFPADQGVRVPHVGWNDLRWGEAEPMFRNVAPGADFFFDHGYRLLCEAPLVAATVDYAGRTVAAVRSGRIWATQFHPERSQNNGLRVLRNFLDFADGALDA